MPVWWRAFEINSFRLLDVFTDITIDYLIAKMYADELWFHLHVHEESHDRTEER